MKISDASKIVFEQFNKTQMLKAENSILKSAINKNIETIKPDLAPKKVVLTPKPVAPINQTTPTLPPKTIIPAFQDTQDVIQAESNDGSTTKQWKTVGWIIFGAAVVLVIVYLVHKHNEKRRLQKDEA